MSAGKGDKPRPVDKKIFDQNFENIEWVKETKTAILIKNKKGKITYKY